MIKVITYGTYDLLHYGHIKLLERAKALGDYLIVGVTSDSYDRERGKINIVQNVNERVAGVRTLGLADEIIIEEYEGQKIDDIKKYDVDIFAIGSDWENKFNYLKDYCEVIYLERTEGVSSTSIRESFSCIKLGLVGESKILKKVYNESFFVNGLMAKCFYSENSEYFIDINGKIKRCENYSEMLEVVDAVYIISSPEKHYEQIEAALKKGVHVLCESPIVLRAQDYEYLLKLSVEKKCILMDAVKTAYATAYHRMILLAKSGVVGDIVSVDTTCTSLRTYDEENENIIWNSLCAWAPNGLMAVFQLLGPDYKNVRLISKRKSQNSYYDLFTQIQLIYNNSLATVNVGQGVKSEGDMVVSGTEGYIYVPAPWWKMDYFEIRKENPKENKRYYFQLDGEGIRDELVAFKRSIDLGKNIGKIDLNCSRAIIKVVEDYYSNHNVFLI